LKNKCIEIGSFFPLRKEIDFHTLFVFIESIFFRKIPAI